MNDLTPGTWTLDPTHTAASFTVRHAGISKVRGQFTELEGALQVAEGGQDLAFSATLKTESVSTSNADRDGHLRSGDFFDAETFPEIRFTSTGVEGETLTGELTIRDITKPVSLDFAYEGAATDPFGTYRAGFTGETTISRKEFGLTWNAALEAGGVLVADEVKISIEAEFTAPTAA
ncbi:YceI family protein [Brachybacterium saurashtrense]|uniref:YceI family protein n=1 Tax=Brachybacterium saurashtrense TaxID=556288 RepID=A0A345YPJ2_9MICO|nr:YceI family protein [Brachybacterium saurashtrense]AXK45844.1 YceI family protein [Brachybacterium saurashtrense]RRR24863.1 YceI family protein [Brachybacterium saurashtrense]